MPKSEARQHWHKMAADARKIESNSSVPLWQKAYQVPGCYQGLELDKLSTRDHQRIMNTLIKLNTILAPYQFKSFDDYQLMEDKDIRRILFLAKRLAPKN